MNTHNTHVTRGRSYLPLRRPADTVLSQLSVELYQPPTYQNSAFESKGGLSLHLSLQVPSDEEEEEKEEEEEEELRRSKKSFHCDSAAVWVLAH